MNTITIRKHMFAYLTGFLCAVVALLLAANSAHALTPLPTPDPKPGSYGIEATKKKAPPTTGATITTPGNGASFTTSPITVSGICPGDLLVQIFNNGVMVGAINCTNGSFSLQVSLFPGSNELTALVYDEIDQPGPASGAISVTYTDTNLSAFGQTITLTSSYGRRSAAAGSGLTWPLQLSGGTGPYAFSIDWGDGSAPELKSQALAGVVGIGHTYKRAGIYRVNVKVTDTNGVTAFLSLIAVANGKVDAASQEKSDDDSTGAAQTKILWIPAAISAVMLPLSFWLGRQSQVVSLRNRMLRESEAYKS